MATTFSELMSVAKPLGDDIPTLKKLPIAYVLEKQGIEFEDRNDAHLYALCPFHDDTAPSFDVYGESLERWGCFSCGIGGDVLDLIQKLFATSNFSETKAIATSLLQSKIQEDWKGPVVGAKKTLDIEAVRKRVDAARLSHTGAIDEFLRIKSPTNPGLGLMDSKWLQDVFGLGESSGSIIVPFWNRAGTLVTLKHRSAHTKALSEPGSSFSEILYAEWLDTDERRTVLLCEGESDTWAAMWAVGNEYAVMGLPTGVGAHPKQAEHLVNRDIILAFDGDEAGRRGTERWHQALLKQGCTVRIAQLGDDLDIAKLAPDQIRAVIERSRSTTVCPPGLDLQVSGMFRVPKGDTPPAPVANWMLEPRRELIDTSGRRSYEGVLHPLNTVTVLSSNDLAGQQFVKGWSSRHGCAWFGTDRDAQVLLGILESRGPFLAVGRMTTVAGLHEGHFVFPGGRIGPDYWVFSPPPADVHLEGKFSIEEEGTFWHAKQVNTLRELHKHSVMDPILAWLAVAPLRSLLREFPILSITGSSGTGKTTLLETVLPAFTGTHISLNLTNTTNHSLFSFVGSTNAFPVHFDEYRPGARRDTLLGLQQILRDAYTSQPSAKGGMGERWAEVISVEPTAPIIVSGEDAFSETSHTERMVLIGLPLFGKNPAVLAEVDSWENNGLPWAYLSYLQEGLRDGWLPQIINYRIGGDSIQPRQQLNMGVLDLGWTILNDFVVANGGEALGAPDLTGVFNEAFEAAQSSPIFDALIWCQDEPEALKFMNTANGMVFIRPENFVAYITKYSSFVLPGGVAAVKRYLRQHLGAVSCRETLNGIQVRGMTFSAAMIGS